MFSSPEASRHAYLDGLGALGQIFSQLLRIGRDLAKLKRASMFGSIGDRLAQFLLSSRAKPRQLGHAPGFARCLQIGNGVDVQLLVQRLNFFRAKPRNRKQIENRARKLRAQFLEKFE